MTHTQPSVNPSAKYSIKDTAALLGIHRETLYKYTHTTNEIKCGWHQRGGKAVKFYLGRDILKFWNNHF